MREAFERDGRRLEYEISREGTPFVFLHGLGGGIHQIAGVYPGVEGIQLINMNQQGHGESQADWESYGFDAMGDDAVALLDHLGIEKAIFGGISMGAAVSLNVAVRFPERVRGLFLIRNAWTDGPMDPDRITAYGDMGRCLKEGGFEAFRKTSGWEIVKEPSAYTKKAFTLPFGEDFNIKNYQKFILLPPKQPIPDELSVKGIRVPTQIVACKGDFCHPFEKGVWLSERIPGACFTEIPNKDEAPKEHNQILAELLKKTLPLM